MTCKALKEAVDRLVTLDDRLWAYYTFLKDPLHKKIENKQRNSLIENSIRCAEIEYKKLLDCYDSLKVEDYLQRYSIKIVEDFEQQSEIYRYFSIYNYVNQSIRVSYQTINLIYKAIEENELKETLGNVNIKDIVLAHELFHHIEEITDDIYTRQKNIAITTFGRFKNKTRALSASEISAVHFSKLLMKAQYSPAVFEILLVYSRNKIRGMEIANKILNLDI